MLSVLAAGVVAHFVALHPRFETAVVSVSYENNAPTGATVKVTNASGKNIVISRSSYDRPCHVTSLPSEWHPSVRGVVRHQLTVGGQTAVLKPGEEMLRHINFSENYRYTAVPGLYLINCTTIIKVVDINGIKLADVTYSKQMKINVNIDTASK